MGRLGVLAAGLVLAATAGLTTTPGWAEPGQTSDGARGERALPLPRALRAEDSWTTLVGYPVAPGVSFEQFTLTGARGVTRGQLVRIDPATPGVGLDLVAGAKVAERQPVADVVDPDAVVAVNGDFFDIRDTEAPLGVARD